MIETTNLKLEKAELHEPYSLSQNNDNLDKIDKIVESGENLNGSYIKFTDGTMICKRTFPYIDVNVDSNTNIEIEYTSPATFIERPAIMSSGELTTSDGAPKNGWLNSSSLDGNTIRIRAYNIDISRIQQIRRMSYIAIGRWK